MDMPIGTSLRSGLKTRESNMLQVVSNMLSKGFTGYVICTVENLGGIEQGFLIFKKGEVSGAYYEFITHSVEVSGNPAIRLVLNSFLSPNGVIDINSLTAQQIDLITAFQEKILVSEAIDTRKLQKIYPRAFNKELSREYVKNQEEGASRFEIFKRTGLLGVEEK